MPADLQRDPDTLERAAAMLRVAAADLRAAAPASGDPGTAAAHGADARRIADELDSLAATAARTATETRAADLGAAALLRPGRPGGAGWLP